MDTLGQPFPSIPAPFVRVLDNDGNLIGHGLIEQIWLQLLIALWQRTGGAQGVDSIEALLFAVSSTDASVAAASQAELSPLLQQTIEREVQRFVLELSPRAADTALEALLFVEPSSIAATAINVSYDDSVTGLGANVQVAIDTLFTLVSGAGTGDVVGPAGATTNDIVLFDGATGLLIKDSNTAITLDGTLAANSDALIPSEKAVKTYVDATVAGISALSLIQEVITAGSQASVTFSPISATYRDLEVRIRGRGDNASASVNVQIQFNGDTGANYNIDRGFFTGTTPSSGGSLSTTSLAFVGFLPAASASASFAGFAAIHIANYRGTTFDKVVAGFGGTSLDSITLANTGFMGVGGLWKSTAAINAVKVMLSAGNFVNDSVVSLYGRM